MIHHFGFRIADFGLNYRLARLLRSASFRIREPQLQIPQSEIRSIIDS